MITVQKHKILGYIITTNIIYVLSVLEKKVKMVEMISGQDTCLLVLTSLSLLEVAAVGTINQCSPGIAKAHCWRRQ
jgi:hypothetical protein